MVRRISINWNQFLIAAITGLSLGIIVTNQLKNLRDLEKKDQPTLSKAEYLREVKQTEIRLDWLKHLPNLGLNNLVADWAFLQFLQYFGDWQARGMTGYSLAPKFFEVIVQRDPRFIDIYPFLSVSVSLYAGQPRQTVALMDQGLKSLTPQMPNAFYVWVYKSTDELLFLGDVKAALQSNAKAIEWAEIQNTPDSLRIAALSRRTAAFLEKNPLSKKAQVSAWMLILGNATDDRTRALVVKQIEKLGGRLERAPGGVYKLILPEND